MPALPEAARVVYGPGSGKIKFMREKFRSIISPESLDSEELPPSMIGHMLWESIAKLKELGDLDALGNIIMEKLTAIDKDFNDAISREEEILAKNRASLIFYQQRATEIRDLHRQALEYLASK